MRYRIRYVPRNFGSPIGTSRKPMSTNRDQRFRWPWVKFTHGHLKLYSSLVIPYNSSKSLWRTVPIFCRVYNQIKIPVCLEFLFFPAWIPGFENGLNVWRVNSAQLRSRSPRQVCNMKNCLYRYLIELCIGLTAVTDPELSLSRPRFWVQQIRISTAIQYPTGHSLSRSRFQYWGNLTDFCEQNSAPVHFGHPEVRSLWIGFAWWFGSAHRTSFLFSEQGIDSTSAHHLFLLISLFVFMDAAAGSAK